MKQRFTAKRGSKEEWIKNSVTALQSAGYTNVQEGADIITAKVGDRPIAIAFVTNGDKTSIEITGDEDLIRIYKSAVTSVFKNEPVTETVTPINEWIPSADKNVQINNTYVQQGPSSEESEESEESYFDGGLLQLIGWVLLGILVTVFTFGICFPWAFCMIYSWEASHKVINGHRLFFDGTAIQLFGNWIKWLLLTIITFGIYSFWLGIKLEKWKTKHTHFAN